MSLINTNPTTWFSTRWPYPRPAAIRNMKEFSDRMDRSYAKVHNNDLKFMELHRPSNGLWYWVALPALEDVDELKMNTGAVIVGKNGRRYRVGDIGLPWHPRRRIAVLLLRPTS